MSHVWLCSTKTNCGSWTAYGIKSAALALRINEKQTRANAIKFSNCFITNIKNSTNFLNYYSGLTAAWIKGWLLFKQTVLIAAFSRGRP